MKNTDIATISEISSAFVFQEQTMIQLQANKGWYALLSFDYVSCSICQVSVYRCINEKKIQFSKTAAKPCTAEVKTAIFFSIKLSVINVETDRQ